MMQSENKSREASLRKLCLAGVISTEDYWKFSKKRKLQSSTISSYKRKQFKLSKYTDDDAVNFNRFTKFQIQTLVRLLKLPHTFSVYGSRCTGTYLFVFANNLTTVVVGLEGLCILLRRLSYPNRLCDLVRMFHRDQSTISRIFNHMLKFIYFRHRQRMQTLNQNWILTRLENFSQCCVEAGSWYPNVVGFIDGTGRPICRPTYHQKYFYSGYKKQHILKYQSIVFPNGLIGRLDGPFIGRRHDAAILNLSHLRQEMEHVFIKPTSNYALYGDPGYSNSQFIKVGYKNHQKLSEKQKVFNTTMSAFRVSVEYGFGKILQLFAFVDFKKNQKIYLQNIKMQYYVAALLVNCYICMNGSQICDFFKCLPPSIHEYLQ